MQSRAQRISCLCLHLGINGRAHRQAARKELAFAKVLRQLAADFISKIITGRQGGAETGEIPILHRAQRLLDFNLINGVGDVAVFKHFPQHIVAPFLQPRLTSHRMEFPRRLGHRGQRRRLMGGQLTQGLVEIALRRCRHPVGVLPEKNLVEIKFKDLILVQRLLQTGGEDDLFDLARRLAVAGQQEVFHHLLGDRRRPAHVIPARAHRLNCGGGNTTGIIAIVGIEILVLSRDKRLFHQIRNLRRRGEQAPFLGKLINHPPLARINPADGWWLILRQGFMTGKVTPIDPENRSQCQRNHGNAQGYGAEDRTKEG